MHQRYQRASFVASALRLGGSCSPSRLQQDTDLSVALQVCTPDALDVVAPCCRNWRWQVLIRQVLLVEILHHRPTVATSNSAGGSTKRAIAGNLKADQSNSQFQPAMVQTRIKPSVTVVSRQPWLPARHPHSEDSTGTCRRGKRTPAIPVCACPNGLVIYLALVDRSCCRTRADPSIGLVRQFGVGGFSELSWS